MTSYRIYHIDDKDWTTIRSEFTTKITGKSILPIEWSKVKVTVTKVEPGGEFPNHIDNYHHLFYYLEGIGKGFVGEVDYEIKPSLIVEIPAGIVHGYKNTGNSDMILLTFNIPKET